MVNNHRGCTIHKTNHKKGRKGMTIYRVYKENHPVTPKVVVNVFDFGYRNRKGFPRAIITHI